MFFGLGTLLVASQDNADDDSATASFASDADSFNPQSGLGAPSAATVGRNRERRSRGARIRPARGGLEDHAELSRGIHRRDRTAPGVDQRTRRHRHLVGADARSPLARQAATSDTASCGRTDPAGATVYTADLRGRPVTVVVAGTLAEVFDDATCQRTTLEVLTR